MVIATRSEPAPLITGMTTIDALAAVGGATCGFGGSAITISEVGTPAGMVRAGRFTSVVVMGSPWMIAAAAAPDIKITRCDGIHTVA